MPDTTAPSVLLASVANVTASSANSLTIYLSISDLGSGLNVSTLATGNLNVTGPGGYTASPTYGGVSGNSYVFLLPAPNGLWTAAFDGVWTIALVAAQVFDVAGNSAAAATLGTFRVAIAAGSEPILELIAEDLVTTLTTMTQANGYRQDYVAAVRRELPGNEDVDLRPVVAIGEAEPLTQTATHETWSQTFEVLIPLIEAEGSTDEVDKRVIRAWADVKLALAVDKTRGNLADWTQVTGMSVFPNVAVFHVNIEYETLVDNAGAQ